MAEQKEEALGLTRCDMFTKAHRSSESDPNFGWYIFSLFIWKCR